MKRVSKLSIATMLAAVTLMTSACGKTSSTSTDKELQSAISVINEAMSGTDFDGTSSAIKTEFEKDKEKKIVPTEEILNADKYSNKLQLGNTVFSFPMSAKDFFAKGATLADGKDPSKQVVYKRVQGALDGTQEFEIKYDGHEYYIYVGKSDEENLLLTDGEIRSVGINDDLLLPGGIKEGSPISDLDEKWGEPQVDNIDSRKYIKDYLEFKPVGRDKLEYINTSGYGYEVYLDLDKGVIKLIYTTGFPFSSDTDELIKVKSSQYSLSNGTTTIAYSIPKKLNDNYMLFEYGGKKYVLQKDILDNYTNKLQLDVGEGLDIGEFTDDSVKGHFDGVSYDNGDYFYDYRINGSELSVVEALNHKNWAELHIIKYSGNTSIAKKFYIVSEGDAETITADVIKSQSNLLLTIADSLEVVS